ncbi:aminodeoxychorismate synthase component I [Pelobium manganitolerans]|uniref:Aminodeoxychorismate synthase component I n=1 Tax=Pelobium manganitolerans TaxID=1842495 RepID=A0A419S3S6_9SPHI|nr:anthranilate synthase component I family protein [Pelobium manganitolerans]RKD14299.1 aminodeoxychorismate synthase component I [Pelobium manganitolerans]
MIVDLAKFPSFTEKAKHFASAHRISCILDSNAYADAYSKFELTIAIGAADLIEAKNFDEVASFVSQHQNKWVFGGFSYDLKNSLENLRSLNPDYVQFPEAFFFVPQHLLIFKNDVAEIVSDNAETLFNSINNLTLDSRTIHESVEVKQRFDKATYINTVNQIKAEIARGNIYESNFCMEFYAEGANISPYRVYQKLNQASPTPFSAFLSWNDNYLLCASPERFVAKRAKKLISQPIKGTIKRGLNEQEDLELALRLQNSVKEQQENVMIVDLVRNDLTRSAQRGTVQVEELFGVYRFKQVQHLISTITCIKNPQLTNIEVIKNIFPMGSMTGAPKIKAMELMDHFEKTKRGMYSGAFGYFSPDGDFDFNVVIRSILYNRTNRYLSFQVGSAITFYAQAQQEYEECLLKAKAILEVLT